MRRFIPFALVVTFGFASTAAAQQQMLDLLPQDAALAVFIRHPNDLKTKGDKFIKDSQIDISMRPSELFDMLASALQIANGIDYDRPGGIMLLRSENEKRTKRIIDEEFISNLVAAVAFSDLD